ncbi:uncharacterized protein LOC129598823 [Paramacrobiotus metropolitanus]|uniref:uncharacterized protein LOC129598823 n=1 Tax=Paramacrobiotus metropolitanus TaxID=2943436 RepID=UPI002445A3A9|nr:uncharacterized protein LOC129598823 [Paramacrobiotus metropolitanus]
MRSGPPKSVGASEDHGTGVHLKTDGNMDVQHKDKGSKETADNNSSARQNQKDDAPGKFINDLIQDDALLYQWLKERSETCATADSSLNEARAIPYAALQLTETGLGCGSFGEVTLADWGHKQVAVKTLSPEEDDSPRQRQLFVRELAILAELGRHPHLVGFYGYCPDPLSIVMEYVELGNLHYRLHYCQDPQVVAKVKDGRIKKKIVVGIAEGMTVLHSAGVVHGDLKPDNVLLTREYQPKIIDFGLANLCCKASTVVDAEKGCDYEVFCGTPAYMPPESMVCDQEPTFKEPDFSGDVYAFGILLNEMVTEEEPYADQFEHFAEQGGLALRKFAQQGHRPRTGESRCGSRVADQKLLGRQARAPSNLCQYPDNGTRQRVPDAQRHRSSMKP